MAELLRVNLAEQRRDREADLRPLDQQSHRLIRDAVAEDVAVVHDERDERSARELGGGCSGEHVAVGLGGTEDPPHLVSLEHGCGRSHGLDWII